jgi:hypothetical protein
MTGTNFSSWYNNAEGTFYTAAQLSGINGYDCFVSVNDGSSANQQYINVNGSSTAVAFVGTGGSAIGKTVSNMNTNPVYCAASYKTNNFALSTNGSAVGTDTSGSIPAVNRMYIGVDGALTAITRMNGTIKKIAYYPVRVADAQLQALTGS